MLLEATRPAAPARNVALLRRVQESLEHHFPQLRGDAATQQQNQIAAAISTIASQSHRQYEELHQEKEEAKAASVERMLGVDQLCRLLTMV